MKENKAVVQNDEKYHFNEYRLAYFTNVVV